MKNKGITLVALAIMIVIILILAGITISTGSNLIKNAQLQTLNTNMLLIQAKEKTIAEKAIFENNNTALYKGQKIADMSSDPTIQKLKENGVISESEGSYDKYYLWNQAILNEQGLEAIKLKEDEFFIVNYATDEIIYTKGFKHTDGKIYYKLSETRNLTMNA